MNAQLHRIHQRAVVLCAGAPFKARPPLRDLEPKVTELWKLADSLSNEDARDLSPHRMPLIECLEKLQRAVELSKEDVR